MKMESTIVPCCEHAVETDAVDVNLEVLRLQDLQFLASLCDFLLFDHWTGLVSQLTSSTSLFDQKPPDIWQKINNNP